MSFQPQLPLDPHMPCDRCGGTGRIPIPAPAPPASVHRPHARRSDPSSSHRKLWALGKDTSIHRLVLLACHRLLVIGGLPYVTADLVAREVNRHRPLSRNNVQRVMKNIEDAGWIERTGVTSTDGVLGYRWTVAARFHEEELRHA